jgi:hypothetical protein
MFTALLPSNGRIENTAFSIVACLFIAADTCLPRRCLAMAASTRSTIPTFSSHATIYTAKVVFVLKYCDMHAVGLMGQQRKTAFLGNG